MARVALGIDVGTGGVRAVALDAAGEAVAEGAASLPSDGQSLRMPRVWLDALDRALRGLAGRIDLDAVGALAVDGTSGTVLALDAHERPVGDALMYNDAVDDETITGPIGAVAPRESAVRGGGSALARACVLQRRPGVARILHQADWVAAQLAGTALASDESNALKTGYDPVARCWPDWIRETPVRRELLPEVVPVGSVSGATDGGFGLPRGVPIVAGMTDGCASFLATGASRPGEGVTALGTTMTVKLLSEKPVFAPEYGIYSHRIGDAWLAGGASNSGGGVLAGFFSPNEIRSLSERIDPRADSELDYYPLPGVGERFPVNDPHLQSRTRPRPDDDAAFLHGLLEGIARIEQLGYRRLAELGAPPLATLRTVGGGADNPAWTALRRRLLAVDFRASRSVAAAAGVARVALDHLLARTST